MATTSPLVDQEFFTQTQALVAAWEKNLVCAKPMRQRIFNDYQLLRDAHTLLAQRLRGEGSIPTERNALRSLEQQVAACLEFTHLDSKKIASLRRLLFSDRSRGCRSTISDLEREILERLAERALEE